MDTMGDLDIKEIIVGTSTPEEIEDFRAWVFKNYELNQADHPTGVLSLDVEDIQISRWDFLRMCDPSYEGKSHYLARGLKECTEEEKEKFKNIPDKLMNIPAKVMQTILYIL